MISPIPGIGQIPSSRARDFVSLQQTSDGLFRTGSNGVLEIFSFLDRKEEFIVFQDKTLCLVRSSMSAPAIYPLPEVAFEPPAEAVLMDLDGTSVHSEGFWIWVIEQTTAKLLGNPSFRLRPCDESHVSGHSVSEHLQYCIRTYCPGKTVEEARELYFEITRHEMAEILAGRGRPGAFAPAPYLKEFLLAIKEHGIKIGLVTSGLYEKAWPEVVSAFRDLDLGDPLEFFDALITAGVQVGCGKAGTLGELCPKPHPWLYAETARVGLGIDPSRRHKVIGIEDSAAGIVSIRLAGFSALGISSGNIGRCGKEVLCLRTVPNLEMALPVILGK